ncbi:beta-1,4-mannosyl-glycoprotein beta-1,4-N-acetylglucosaminyltransferase [Sporothrix schenckii 1099-18]|uniref:Beta-1,4-mannosyl-glycoprotein beta-1,4-N-acetylglucosaminyltransferase n=1 Tax=Sporothrix schenckii 1099-18 TaxID=1397361 RepID=A0A0F2M0G6_SPOSC|nr:beta-1,4-mannosyl-glycoprotein beta-1,4-N-acetylglucosaminyltransferase [Sporothrix schenckii 1099-18]KJR82564.1 beta-1,4-mannosyl-glycoprotein beta-1,4-N-acetylglucosaminyltransferase [Sporothrix schenckii 1099-18]
MRRLVPAPFGPGRAVRTFIIVLAGFIVTWCLWSSDAGPGVYDLGPAGNGGSDTGSVAAVEAVCKAHGWRPFVSRPGHGSPGRPRRIYDLCMVNAELDWLEIRLNTTFHEVDYFVIVEGAKTFTGLDKPLTIRDNWGRFAPYHQKMLYHELQYPANFNPRRAWDREDLQRNAMFLQVLGPGATVASRDARFDHSTPGGGTPVDALPGQHDVLVVADVDEIPRPETLRALRLCQFPRRLTLRSQFYYYSFQFRHQGPEWPHPQATFYDGAGNTVLPVNLRNGDGRRGGDATSLLGRVFQLIFSPFTALARYRDTADMPNAGWHCSSCYATMGELMHKLESVSHVWMNHEFFRNRERAAHHVRLGLDLWDRKSEVYDRIANNPDVPSFLLEQPDRYRYLMNRDGESAGFADYPP